MILRQHQRATFWCGILILSIIGLAAAFLLSMAHARRDFHRASISEEQLATVARIEATLASGESRPLAPLLQRYRRSMDREAALLNRPGDRAPQAAEAVRANHLAELALAPATPARDLTIRRLIAGISRGEQGEANEVGRRMDRHRRRMTVLAVLLTGTALLSAILGGVGLAAANRRLSEEVGARTAELATIERSRRLFFAKVSHELRTPVTVMRGEAEVALSEPRGRITPLRDALGRVVAQAEYLDHRIEELLSLARAENGELSLDDDALDLRDVVANAGRAAAAYAQSLEVDLQIGGSECRLPVRGDARWLQQGLVAVLDNAVKFSPTGCVVSLAAKIDQGHAVIAIRDQGSGIAPGELPRIFDAYYQAEAGRDRGGTGLGLALARWVFERHGGAIGARNDSDGGCVMTIRLPLTA